MGQTPSSSSHVDYTFGMVANKANRNSNSTNCRSTITGYRSSDEDEQGYLESIHSGVAVKEERLLLYPQQYGLEDDSFGNDNDDDNDYSEDNDNDGKRENHHSSSSRATSLSNQRHQHAPLLCFRTASTQPSKQPIDRVDSGYASDHDAFEQPKKVIGGTTSLRSNRLAQDILYVDQTYYNDLTKPDERLQQQQQQYHSTLMASDSVSTMNGEEEDDDDMLSIGTKLTFAGAALASQDASMREICLSRRSLIDVNPNIGLLTSLRKLDLSNNQLIDLPDSIGQLKHLEVLSISSNRLQHLPDTLQCLSRLTELDLSHNQLQHIPSLGHFSSLCILLLSHNQLSSIPSDLAGMKQLVTLDLTHNPSLSVLPAEITRLSKLRRLRLDQCHKLLDHVEHQSMEVELAHDPPSLMEICARKIVLSLSSTSNSTPKRRISSILKSSSSSSSSQAPITTKHLTSHLSGHLLSYLASANVCSSCHGPYYESHVIRHRLIEKSDMWIPLEYRLCSAHWSDETDRLLNMFHNETSSITQGNTDSKMTATLTALQSLALQQDLDQGEHSQEQDQACIEMDSTKSDSAPGAGKVTFLRHPQRLQRVMNKNPSTFLIHKIHFS